ncbi:cell division protein FtsA [bacterium]|nr:cell division protein FtsA [candidate division CSSED10-310 bacterium]
MRSVNVITAGLDLGSTKIAAALVGTESGSPPQLLGFSQKRCRFMRDGAIVNLEVMTSVVQECLEELRSLVKYHVHDVVVNLPAGSIRSESGEHRIEMGGKREVKHRHIQQLLHSSRLVDDEDWIMIHSIPEEFFLDDQRGIRSAVGMIGSSLGVRMHQIYAPRRTVDSILFGVAKSRLKAVHLVIDPMASMESLITQDEQELGVWLVDIGGGYSSLAAIRNNRILLLTAMDFGGDSVTSDIAIGVRTPIRDAEEIKIKHGRAIPELADEELEMEITPLGGGRTRRKITQQLLTEIIQPRMEEILDMIAQTFHGHLDKNDYHAGVILTGGGSLIRGVKELAEKHFQLPVIQGNLREIEGLPNLAPAALTSNAVGLALYGQRHPTARSFGQMPVHPISRFFKHSTLFRLGGFRK